MSVQNKLGNILYNLYLKLEQDAFIEFVTENYDDFEHVERLLSATYNDEYEYLDFESFVELAIQTLKPDFEGKVYVKYNRYYSVEDEGERFVNLLGQEADQMHLSQVPKFITQNNGDSLGVNLEHEQELEIVLAILNSGEYELPESDFEDGTVEISINKPKLIEDSYDEDQGYVDFEEPVKSIEPYALTELDEKLKDF